MFNLHTFQINMNNQVIKFVSFLEAHKHIANKEILCELCQKEFGLILDRKVYHNDYFAVRFCYSKDGKFSNTVLSLSALEKYDRIPFFVVLVKGNADNVTFVGNTTFLSKISHSSQQLAMDNIKGSFNGSDIIKSYNGLSNEPMNFEELFAIHEGMEWEDNLKRLVDASAGIKPCSEKFNPDALQEQNLMEAPNRAKAFIESKNYCVLLEDLQERCRKSADAIIVASRIENVNIRGRLIEALITTDNLTRRKLLMDLSNLEKALPIYDTKNGLGDYVRHFEDSDTYTDIKTKIVYLGSNPKAYNIDKFLKCMSEEKSVFLFFFIGIDQDGIMNTILASVFHQELLDTMQLQFHWAGRSTRGVAQFVGTTIDTMLKRKKFKNNISTENAVLFLKQLLDR